MDNLEIMANKENMDKGLQQEESNDIMNKLMGNKLFTNQEESDSSDDDNNHNDHGDFQGII